MVNYLGDLFRKLHSRNKTPKIRLEFIPLLLFLAGCSTTSTTPTLPLVTGIPTDRATALVPSLTASEVPVFYSSPIPSLTATLTPLPLPFLCSPLAGISLVELPQLMTGDKFVPPLPGRDDGHHGVDFAFYRWGSLTTMLGLPVQAILPGRVAAVIDNLVPYGNAIIIETPLEALSFGTAGTIILPTSAPTVQPDPRLTCPTPDLQPWLAANHRSLYYLYGHLNKLPVLKVGDKVSCGQAVGEVGTSGNSVNPHLHLETRLGPAGVTFTGLGHYDTRTTVQERANYCIWRVSGWFQMFDPMTILSAGDPAARSK